MILYQNSTKGFKDDVDNNAIADSIETAYVRGMGRRAGSGEKRAWNNSMQFMETIVRRADIPDDCGVLIEYTIPSTSKRIDFVITGYDENNRYNFLIIELKQWESAEATDKEGLVRTVINQGMRETTHPSYQAYSYKKYLRDMNVAVYEGKIRAVSCAYLHNYKKQPDEPLLQDQYKEILTDTPVFFRSDAEKLEDFVRRYVGKGNGIQILYEVENGRIIPSKKFVEYVTEVFTGNPVYTLMDEQMVAYFNIISIAKEARQTKQKTTMIVNGGPGTGKSVVAMNAFVKLLNEGLNVRFVAPNASFRECMVDTLGRQKAATKKRLKALFSGSGSYVDAYENEFDVLICDEAQVDDVRIPECNFSMPWNSRRASTTWATDIEMRNQVGCIHTSQGLEFDYVGVIIGNDMRYDPITMEVYGDYENYYDATGKKGLKNQQTRLTMYIKNIYKVLLSRGMKGCYVYCRDPELMKYFKERQGQ